MTESARASTEVRRAGGRDDHRLERGNAASQARRKDLLDFGESAHGGLLDSFDASGGGAAQAERDCDSLIIVEEQRRHGLARTQLVPALDAGSGVDRVAEGTKFIDIAAEGPGGDVEAAGEIAAGPVAAALEKREELQEPG